MSSSSIALVDFLPPANPGYALFCAGLGGLVRLRGLEASSIINPHTKAPVIREIGHRNPDPDGACLAAHLARATFQSKRAGAAAQSRISGVSGYFQEHRTRIAANLRAQAGASPVQEGYVSDFVALRQSDLLLEALTDEYRGRAMYITFVKKGGIERRLRLSSNGTRLIVSSADDAECAIFDKRIMRRAFAALREIDSDKRVRVLEYATEIRYPLLQSAGGRETTNRALKIEKAFPEVRRYLKDLPRFDADEFACVSRLIRSAIKYKTEI